MKPAPFEYHAPTTVEEAVELLARGDGARVLAGGQSLVQLMKFRVDKPSALVDINGVRELETIELRDGELHLGALVRQQTLLEDQLIAEGCPLLREAARFVGYQETRRRGTVAGSLAFAAPWAELTAAAVALDASIDVRSASRDRTIRIRDFFRGPHMTELERDELIVGIRFPVPGTPRGAAFHEVSVRYRDYAQVAAAALVGTDGSAELVMLCVADTPYHVDASAAIENEGALLDLLSAINPADDIDASAAYRRRVAPVLAHRALREATARAEEAA